MKYDDVLKLHGKEDRLIIESKLIALGNTLYGTDRWMLTPLSDDSETKASEKGDWYYVTVGKGKLAKNCNPTEYNRAAYVRAIKDMYHEQRHVWKYIKASNDKTGLNSVKEYKQVTDAVRREFVSRYFPSVYYNNYSNDPNEMDAENYGIKMALIHFTSDPIVSAQEAGEILYQFAMADDNIHENMLKPYKDGLKSIHDVLDVFEEKVKTAVFEKYQITDKIMSRFEKDVSDEDLLFTHRFLLSDKFKEYRDAFNKCNDGIEQDKVMEQVILFVDDKNIRKAPLRLRAELESCRRQMELGTLGTGPHAISPKRINYSIQGVELTEEDVAAIPVDNGSMDL